MLVGSRVRVCVEGGGGRAANDVGYIYREFPAKMILDIYREIPSDRVPNL